MGSLAVTVRLNGAVVEERTITVSGPVRIGEGDYVAIGFSGGTVEVAPEGNRLRVSLPGTDAEPRSLASGEEVVLGFGPVDVRLVHVSRERRSRNPTRGSGVSVDGRLLAAVGILLVALALAESLDERFGGAREAEPTPESDDGSAAAHRAAARRAWEAGYWEGQRDHLDWLVERYPDDVHDALRLAIAERRRGGTREVELFRSVLARDASSGSAATAARYGLVLALARAERAAAAETELDALDRSAPLSPLGDLGRAAVFAAGGDTDESIRLIGRSLGARDQLDPELQVEVLRDVLLDPVFARSRADGRFAPMVRRRVEGDLRAALR